MKKKEVVHKGGGQNGHLCRTVPRYNFGSACCVSDWKYVTCKKCLKHKPARPGKVGG